MDFELSDFVPSGDTITFQGKTYGVPGADADVMLRWLDLNHRLSKAAAGLGEIDDTTEDDTADADAETVFARMQEHVAEIKQCEHDIRTLAVDVLKAANQDVPDDLPLPKEHAAFVVRLALNGRGNAETPEQAVAKILGLELTPNGDGADADPPTRQKAGQGTLTVPRSRSATRSRKRSSR